MAQIQAKQKLRRLRRALSRENGNATIEFVILFPAIMTLFLSAFEVSIYLARSVLLDRALDITVRELRLGSLAPQSADELKRDVCNNALIFKDCLNAMNIELTKVSTDTWDLPNSGATCVDRSENIKPAVNVTFGQANDVMVVRACAVLDPFFPSTPWVLGVPRDASGGVQIVSASTFVNEP